MIIGAATVYLLPLKWVGVLPAFSAFSGRHAEDTWVKRLWRNAHEKFFPAKRKSLPKH